jgi:hypothetical protein
MPKENPGQISSLQVTIGGQTVDPALVAGIMIKQCLSQKFGPIGRISVIDAERNLAKIKGDGSETAEVSWTDHNGQRFNFQFMVDTGQNIDSHSDGSDTNNSARKHNTYIFTLNGKDTKKVNGGVVYGAKDKPVEEHLKKIYEKLDSKPLITKVKTNATSLNFNQMSFDKAVQKCLNNSKVQGSEKSSYCLVYCDKDGNPVLNSYENMFSGSSVANFTESATNTVPDDGIIFNVSSSNIFMNPASIRKCDADTSQFNGLNGGLRLGVKPKTNNFRTAGRNPGKKGAGNENNTIHNCPDPLNNRYEQGKYSIATNRYNFETANLNDIAAEFTVFPRPGVDIGKKIITSILAKDDKNTTTGNPKINGEGLVRTIIHRIGAVGEEPRYTQVLQTLKGDPEGR